MRTDYLWLTLELFSLVGSNFSRDGSSDDQGRGCEKRGCDICFCDSDHCEVCTPGTHNNPLCPLKMKTRGQIQNGKHSREDGALCSRSDRLSVPATDIWSSSSS